MINWKTYTLVALAFVFISACNSEEEQSDAYGNFEADEIVISAKGKGELLSFQLKEGDLLKKDAFIGYIDTTVLHLQRAEIFANLSATEAQKENIEAQLKVAKNELKKLQSDQHRIQKMYDKKAATKKQLDDINSAVEIATNRLQVLNSQYPAIKAQSDAIAANQALLEQQINDSKIVNPIQGTVLNKLTFENEMVSPGKPLYIIAQTEELFLKAYVSSEQLGSIKIGQKVNVLTDAEEGAYHTDEGVISWISSKSEFTPKTIQTKNERANTVYAFKVRVKNDGRYKIGMHGEVQFNEELSIEN